MSFKKTLAAVSVVLLMLFNNHANAAFMVTATEGGPGSLAGTSIYTYNLVGMAGDPSYTHMAGLFGAITFNTGLTGITVATGTGTIADGDGDFLNFSAFSWSSAGSFPTFTPTATTLDLATVNSSITIEATSGQTGQTWNFNQLGSVLTSGTVLPASPPPASVPEPSSFALFGIVGVAGLVYRRKKRAKNA